MKLVNEIKEIKRLIKLIENVDDTNSNVMVIGDKIAMMLQSDNIFKNVNLIDPTLTVDSLSDRVSEEEINTEIDEIFISVGSNELFNPNENISGLVYNLEQVYPNARLHLIKGYVNANKFGYDTDKIEDIKNDSILFFNLFKKDNVLIVGEEITGKFDIIGSDIVKSTSNYIEKIRRYVDRFVIESDFDLDDTDIAQSVSFVDMDIDEQTDFDTIYEFLDVFEKIVKSNNTYSTSLSSKYIGEVELIQIALSFLGFGSISNTGHYDEKTAEAIEMFQSQNQLKVNGKADKNTMTELFWELKARGFEDDDLAKFIKNLDVVKKDYPVDSYNLEDYCDKIIDNFEGGYANKVHFKDAADNEEDPDMKAAIENSSETMLGIDRFAGDWDNDPVGSKFWQLVDDNSGWAPESAGKPKWSHGYMGGSIEGQLRNYVYDMMIPRFESLKNQYLSSESKKLVEEDKRLTMHLLYAVWNGSGFFQDFADVINSEVSSGNTDRDSLYEVAIDSRVHNGNGAIAKVGNKVKNVIDNL